MKKFPYRTLALLVAVFLVIIVPFCFFGEAVNAWTARLIEHAHAHPLQTGSLLTLLLAADILIPVPSSLVSTACGMTLGFLGGTCASFIGMTLSSAAGLLLGRSASTAAQRLIGPNEITQLQSFHKRHGIWLLLALRPVPVLAETSVVFCGLARHSLPQALAVTSLGNVAVSATYAAVGVWGRLSDSFLPAFGASMLLSGVLLSVARLKRKAAPRLRPAA